MLMLLFVNKPITFALYLLSAFAIFLLIFMQEGVWSGKLLAFIFLFIAFTILYATSIPYFYLLRGNEKAEIKGFNIKTLKGPFRCYLLISLIGTFTFTLALIFNQDYMLIFLGFVLIFYNAICSAILLSVAQAKFFSQAIKANPTLKMTDVNDFYADIRAVLLKKVIS